MEFKAFPKIEKLSSINMNITQKIHGSNASVFIVPVEPVETLIVSDDGQSGQIQTTPPDFVEVDGKKYTIKAGSRNRWVTPLDDNYGFASFVEKHKEDFIRLLGIGHHFGEWTGLGINSGEGLKEKKFVLFDFWKYPPERPLPPQTVVVPVLYSGPFDLSKIEEVMEDLKINGSKLVSGFMNVEGVVVGTMGTRFKKVFAVEETKWTKPSGSKVKTEQVKVDLSYLLQPIRMEKLLSRDERYLREYPKSLSDICKDYVTDLEQEGQLIGEPEVIIGIKKHLGGQLFPFAREMAEKQLQMQGGL